MSKEKAVLRNQNPRKKNYEVGQFFAYYVPFKLASPQAAQRSLSFYAIRWKISSVAPAWGTCLEIHH